MVSEHGVAWMCERGEGQCMPHDKYRRLPKGGEGPVVVGQNLVGLGDDAADDR